MGMVSGVKYLTCLVQHPDQHLVTGYQAQINMKL